MTVGTGANVNEHGNVACYTYTVDADDDHAVC